jgi:glycosyltransferase involved in cell wall biosynthesis
LSNFSINVISPFYNEEKVAIKSLTALKELKKNFSEYVKDIIVVDDGSTDSTGEIINFMNTEEEFIVIRNTQNYGVAFSFLRALQFSKSDFTLFVPGDYTYSPLELGKVVNLVIENKDKLGIYLGVRDPNRVFRSYSREFAAFLSRLSFIFVEHRAGIIPNYGLLLLPNQFLKSVPIGIKNYGAAIGLLGTCLVFRPRIYKALIHQVEGSEKRSAKLNLSKVLDAIVTLVVIIKNKKSIRKGKSIEY